ncbi:uncharacterized protein LOC135438156 isoform X4 [Drosophila montana]|uniref:uncharacterized protein LOC135438156 isoform X4 n=1 Tax=Drosophila montana TaxID=40370 RepID=UPI00313CEF7C
MEDQQSENIPIDDQCDTPIVHQLIGIECKSLLNGCFRGIDILDFDGNSAYCGPLEGASPINNLLVDFFDNWDYC